MCDMGFPETGTVGPMEVRLPVEYEVARLSDGEVVFADTLPGEGGWAARVDDTSGHRHGGEDVIFGRKAVAAVTDRYACLATTDSLTITRYDEAGNAEVFSLEHFRERADEDWEQRERESLRANRRGYGPEAPAMAAPLARLAGGPHVPRRRQEVFDGGAFSGDFAGPPAEYKSRCGPGGWSARTPRRTGRAGTRWSAAPGVSGCGCAPATFGRRCRSPARCRSSAGPATS